MDGEEATRRIRAMEHDAPSDYKRAIIIALSANVGPEHTIACMDAGCDGSLVSLLSQHAQVAALGVPR